MLVKGVSSGVVHVLFCVYVDIWVTHITDLHISLSSLTEKNKLPDVPLVFMPW